MPSVLSPQSSCRFGIAVGDSTPPVGIYHRMWGAARHERATGVHRPLRTTAMWFSPLTDVPADDDADAGQLLLAIDHCILGSQELAQILQAVRARTGLAEERIAVTCSHTHAAGILSLDRVGLPGGELIPGYLEQLPPRWG